MSTMLKKFKRQSARTSRALPSQSQRSVFSSKSPLSLSNPFSGKKGAGDVLPETFENEKKVMGRVGKLMETLAALQEDVSARHQSYQATRTQILQLMLALCSDLSMSHRALAAGEAGHQIVTPTLTGEEGKIVLAMLMSAVETSKMEQQCIVPVVEGMRLSSNLYTLKTLAPTRKYVEEGVKAAMQHQAALDEFNQCEREQLGRIESSPGEIDFDHARFMEVSNQLCTYSRRSRKCLVKASSSIGEALLISNLEVMTEALDWYEGQLSFVKQAKPILQKVSQRHNVDEAMSHCRELQDRQVELQQQHQDSFMEDPATLFDPLKQFLLDGGGVALLVTVLQAGGQEEEKSATDMLVRSLDYDGSFLPHLYDCLSTEIGDTQSQSTLLRGNTYVTKILMSYLRMICAGGMASLVDLIQEAIDNRDNLEIDPTKVQEGYDVEENMSYLVDLTYRFFNQITSALLSLPIELREIVQHLRRETEKKFEGKGVQFGGSFIFLRFVCPAIVFPEQNRILPPDVSLTTPERRGVMLVSKALQNAANATAFKEPFMTRMNGEFLEGCDQPVKEFFAQISTPEEGMVRAGPISDKDTVYRSDFPSLFRICEDSMTELAHQLHVRGSKPLVPELAHCLAHISTAAEMLQHDTGA